MTHFSYEDFLRRFCQKALLYPVCRRCRRCRLLHVKFQELWGPLPPWGPPWGHPWGHPWGTQAKGTNFFRREIVILIQELSRSSKAKAPIVTCLQFLFLVFFVLVVTSHWPPLKRDVLFERCLITSCLIFLTPLKAWPTFQTLPLGESICTEGFPTILQDAFSLPSRKEEKKNISKFLSHLLK